jgi:hypothetical protein
MSLTLVAEYLTIPKDGRPSRMYISEVGHLLRVASIYSQMVGFAAESSLERLRKLDPTALSHWRNSAEATIQSHESALEVRPKIGHVFLLLNISVDQVELGEFFAITPPAHR